MRPVLPGWPLLSRRTEQGGGALARLASAAGRRHRALTHRAMPPGGAERGSSARRHAASLSGRVDAASFVPRRRLLLLGLAGGLAGLTACTSPAPDLFTLRAVPGQPRPGPARVLLLQRPNLPRYLDRPAVVTDISGYRVEAGSGDRWAEPIGGMFARVLAQDLSQRLPNATVLGEQGSLGLTPDVTIDLDVREFGPDGTGSVVLQAQVAQRSGRTATRVRSVRLSTRPAGGDTAALVAGMSNLVGQLADEIAGSVVS